MAHPLSTPVLFASRMAGSLAISAAVLHSAPSHALDTLSFEAGTGNKTRLIRVGAQWKWEKKWQLFENAQVGGYWDLNLARWRSDKHKDNAGVEQEIAAIGITPVFRLSSGTATGTYVELGTGAHLLSELYDANRRQLSTRFQFGSHLGLGYVFSNGLDLAIRYQHYSNASIKKPNDGVNFTVVRIAFPF